MFVYWGGQTGAKKNLKKLLIYNSKDYVEHYPYNIVHAKHICHHTPKLLRYDSLWDTSRKADITSRRVDNPDEIITVSTGWERDIDCMCMLYNNNTCDTSHRIFGGFAEGSDADRFFYRRRYKIKNNPKQVPALVELPLSDIPECHLVFPYHRRAMYSFEGVKFSDWFRSQTNIVPYKSDLVECVINQLDNWGEYNSDKPWWKVDKKKIWEHLDLTVFVMWYKVEKKLREAGIEYEYFDLDKDDWAKTFHVQKNLPRQIMHHVYVQFNRLEKEKKKKAYEDYRRMTEVAKEYIISRGKKDNRL